MNLHFNLNLKSMVLLKKGLIYIIEHNELSNLKYVGQSKDSLNKRWNGHLSTFKQFDRMYYRLCFFVNYYGVENFSIREYKIYNNITDEYLDNEEKKYIFELGTLNIRDSNDNITIKITNELKNELINKLIDKKTNISNIYKLIDTFEYDYKRNKLDFIINENNSILIENLLKSELIKQLINMEIRTSYDFKDENNRTCCQCLKITEEILEEEMIIEDFIKYIKYFHKEFEITNNKEDIYYTKDLLFGLEQYGDEQELFDYYLIRDFSKIIQCYFNIYNINLNNNIIYGIKKIIPISFILYDNLNNLIRDSLEEIDYKKNKNYKKYLYNKINNHNISKLKDIYNNRLYIKTLKDNLYSLWHSIYIKDKRNKNYEIIDKYYSYDYNNLDYISNNLIIIINNIIERYSNIFKIVDNEYIMFDEY